MTIRGRAGGRQPAVPWVLTVGIAVAGAIVAIGVTPWLAFAVAALPWFVVLRRRVGALLSLTVVLIGAYLIVLGIALLTAAVRIDLLGGVVVVVVTMGLLGCLALGSVAPATSVGSTDRLLPAFATIGPAIWGVAAIFWAFLPDEQRLGWVMRNDSVNNLVFAREAITQHGILIGGEQNPAPLPAAIVALAASAGRAGTPSGKLLTHDLDAMSATWLLLIALTGFLAGCLSGEVARRASASRVPVRWATALGSVLVLSWYFTGYPMEYGFINVSVALPVLFASVLLFLRSAATPWLALSGLFATSLLMLAIWSPLVVVPGALALSTLLVERQSLRHPGRRGALIVIGALVGLLLYFVAVSVPSLLGQRGALSSPGGVHAGMEWVVYVVGFAVLLAGLLLSRLQLSPLLIAACAVVLSSWLGATVLLVLNRHATSPWTYYPVKFVGIASLVLLVILLGMIVTLVAHARTPWARWTGATATAAVIVFLAVWSPTTINFDGINPVARLFATHPLENLDKVHRYVLSTADPDHPTIAWKLLSPSWADGEANMWLIQLRSDNPRLSAVNRRLAAASYGATSATALCTIQRTLGPNLTVETTDKNLAAELRSVCPDSTARVVIRPTPR